MNLEAFISTISDHHVVFYNDKIVEMSYVSDKKTEFKIAGMRIADNVGLIGCGYIKTPKGLYYKVSNSNRSAKKISVSEIK